MLFNTLFIQYLDTNSISNQTPRTTIAIFLPFIINFANAPMICSIGGLETAVNYGVGVVKEAIILPLVINPVDIPMIHSIRVHTPGPQAESLLNKTCSDP